MKRRRAKPFNSRNRNNAYLVEFNREASAWLTATVLALSLGTTALLLALYLNP